MNIEFSETNEKLEQIEASALENITEVSPLETIDENEVYTESVAEYNVSFEGHCSCAGVCGGNYSNSDKCSCSGGCGQTHHK